VTYFVRSSVYVLASLVSIGLTYPAAAVPVFIEAQGKVLSNTDQTTVLADAVVGGDARYTIGIDSDIWLFFDPLIIFDGGVVGDARRYVFDRANGSLAFEGVNSPLTDTGSVAFDYTTLEPIEGLTDGFNQLEASVFRPAEAPGRTVVFDFENSVIDPGDTPLTPGAEILQDAGYVDLTGWDFQRFRVEGNSIQNITFIEVDVQRLIIFPDPTGVTDGDFSLDGELGMDDIDILMATWHTYREGFDLDGDEQLDTDDIGVWLSDHYGSAFGDANLDRTVDAFDFAALAANFNQEGIWSQGDFNGDGIVDAFDFASLAANFNQSFSPPAATPQLTPEPTTAGALAGLALAMTRRRKRG